MWTLLYGVDALPDVGLWATVGFPRALDVIDRGNGNFVMCTGHLFPSSHQMLTYFHADYTAESPSQEHTALDLQLQQTLSIELAGFQDVDGQFYIVYKVDGSSLGGRGPVEMQVMEADALTPTGNPVQMLDHSPQDGPLIEPPILILHNGT
ncbi:glycoside hydrolase family 43 protein [Pisolithus tinctorius Marx 270]|uniref:Glycoside hydrolase family 43 protein n=1 Tax=Pisolithus tinctorius Marx 270 TaxID=870435 RepID=A0A0C3NQZ9_PISTI|nr:glycoside hydrolase family 43 protein [Pisolithus tinctorius Marx 270]